jgi:transcriptional regulator with XRE-family HTH domain
MQSQAGEAIRARLRQARAELGLTQEQVAQEMAAHGLAMSRQTVSKWEAGKGSPNPRELAVLCTIYGVTADWVLTGTPSIPVSDSKMLRQILKPHKGDFVDSER